MYITIHNLHEQTPLETWDATLCVKLSKQFSDCARYCSSWAIYARWIDIGFISRWRVIEAALVVTRAFVGVHSVNCDNWGSKVVARSSLRAIGCDWKIMHLVECDCV